MIEVNNKLSEALGYSSIRYLKSSIVRLFGKDCIVNNYIPKGMVIFLAGKRNKVEFLNFIEEDSTDVYNRAIELSKEINIRNGISNPPYFYGDCDAIGAILYDMYRNGEITKDEFISTIIENNVNIAINIERFRNDDKYTLDLYSGYSSYNFVDDSYTFSTINSDISKSEDYDVPIKTTNNIESLISWDENGANFCFYNEGRLVGNFAFDYPSCKAKNKIINFDNMMENIKELFLFDNIKEDYEVFAISFKEYIEAELIAVETKYIETIKSEAIHKYKYMKCEFYYSENYSQVKCDIINEGKYIKSIYINSKFGNYDFSTQAYENLKDNRGVFDSLCINQAIKHSKTKEVKYERKSYDNYDYKSLLSSTKVKEEDKKFYKNMYRNLSKIYHPDIFTGDGGERYMQLVNDLKTQWGI